MTQPQALSVNTLANATPILNTVQTHMAAGVAPAVSIAVYQHDALVFEAAFGWVDPDARQHPTSPDTYFDLASLTKLYTATAFLSLAAAGRVRLHTPLVDVVPQFGQVTPRPIGGGQNPHTKAPEPADPGYAGQTVAPEDITCWHLLTHTSGLPPWRDVYSAAPPPPPPIVPDHAWPPAKRWSVGLARIVTYAFVAPPDTGIRYSDIGLMLLGEAVARRHGSTLDAAIAARVSDAPRFRPMDAGIPRTEIAPTENDPLWRGRRVWGEVHDENACGMGGITGHAGLFARARDVAAFGNDWLYHAEERFGLDAEAVAEATRLQAGDAANGRGLGWMLKSPENSSAGDLFSGQAYGHTGFTGTTLWVDPSRGVSVALLTNRVYVGRERPGIHEMRRQVHDAVIRALA